MLKFELFLLFSALPGSRLLFKCAPPHAFIDPPQLFAGFAVKKLRHCYPGIGKLFGLIVGGGPVLCRFPWFVNKDPRSVHSGVFARVIPFQPRTRISKRLFWNQDPFKQFHRLPCPIFNEGDQPMVKLPASSCPVISSTRHFPLASISPRSLRACGYFVIRI